MRRTVAAWARTAARYVPHRVGTAGLLVAWVGLAAVFALAGGLLVAGAFAAVHPVPAPVAVPATAVGVFGVAVAPLWLSRRVVASVVERIEIRAIRARDAGRADSQVSFDGGARCRSCRPPTACC